MKLNNGEFRVIMTFWPVLHFKMLKLSSSSMRSFDINFDLDIIIFNIVLIIHFVAFE